MKNVRRERKGEGRNGRIKRRRSKRRKNRFRNDEEKKIRDNNDGAEPVGRM